MVQIIREVRISHGQIIQTILYRKPILMIKLSVATMQKKSNFGSLSNYPHNSKTSSKYLYCAALQISSCDLFFQCTTCGHPAHCGLKEHVFGPNPYCEPKTCLEDQAEEAEGPAGPLQ